MPDLYGWDNMPSLEFFNIKSYNNSLGTYGSWYDTTTQTATLSNTAYPMKFGTLDFAKDISVVSDGTNLTRITPQFSGVFNLQFSCQFQNIDNQLHDACIWLRKNGLDVDNSASLFTIPIRKSASIFGSIITAWNFLVESDGNDYFQLMWSTDDATNVNMPTLPASSPYPQIPSVIMTMQGV